MVTRREFLATSLLAARLKPRAPNSTVEREALAERIRFGYAAITWGSNVSQAIDDIAAVGFRGIQLRGEAVQQFGARPQELRDALARKNLVFAVLSSGNLSIDPAREREMIALHTSHAQFVRDAGGIYLQVIDERPKGRAVVADDYSRLGRLMTELGKRTADLGIPLVYHHHMNSTGEKPHEVDAVLDAADPKHVRLLFDIAHYQQGGGDPVKAIRRYGKAIKVVHLKDVRPIEAAPGYQWVELGRGRVDVKGCVAAMRDIGFDGWAIVELDKVVDADGTPKTSAETNRAFVVNQLGLRL